VDDKQIECQGKLLNTVIAQKIICEIFGGEDLPIYMADIANKTIEHHQKHGGTVPNKKTKIEQIIRWALNDLERCERAEKFNGNYWKIRKRRRMMDRDTIRKMQNDCMNPLYTCLNALNEAKSAIEKNIPLIENEIDIYEVRAQLIGLLDRKEIEQINARRPSLEFNYSEVMDSIEKIMNELEILFDMCRHYLRFMPTTDND